MNVSRFAHKNFSAICRRFADCQTLGGNARYPSRANRHCFSSRMDELRTAQDVIDIVKETISAGNLKNDFMLTSGDSYHRSMAARHIREVDYRGDSNGLAKSAMAAGAGACLEHSELTMAYLSNMDLSRPVFTYANANGPDHRFNIIGDMREPKTAVVVDAWPSFARAHLLNNSAFQPDGSRLMDVH